MGDFYKLIRPYQYTKNLFVFLPAFFAFQILEPRVLAEAFIAFLAFSAIASAVYIINDWFDRFEDAKHPDKSNRPIATGRVSGRMAIFYVLVLLAAGILLSVSLTVEVTALLLFYFVLNIAYSIWLKHVAIVDISIISLGFVLRLFVGAQATSIELSHWIIVMTFLLALFLALAKRRDDVLIYLNTDQKMRKVIDGYNLKFLDSSMVMTASITVLAYILWSISPEVVSRLGSGNLYLTSVFVVLGVLRYLQITLVDEVSGNPSKILLRDRFIQWTLLGWLLCFVLILYARTL
ncbi:decaprenyl-phosphate phosphoribosyltransferase [Thiomicrorhabdus sp.]|uniref:decaprenyl-phosphate phosphoribosyltransferase n=1 Tax=Thiomicrorhabdus sp. TaxID=2039724 RepID=UPI0029C604B3|nr:decaprenyl-phosphate phosphoribosyltransferase [Thiomicrorhabdus sp.]